MLTVSHNHGNPIIYNEERYIKYDCRDWSYKTCHTHQFVTTLYFFISRLKKLAVTERLFWQLGTEAERLRRVT